MSEGCTILGGGQATHQSLPCVGGQGYVEATILLLLQGIEPSELLLFFSFFHWYHEQHTLCSTPTTCIMAAGKVSI